MWDRACVINVVLTVEIGNVWRPVSYNFKDVVVDLRRHGAGGNAAAVSPLYLILRTMDGQKTMRRGTRDVR